MTNTVVSGDAFRTGMAGILKYLILFVFMGFFHVSALAAAETGPHYILPKLSAIKVYTRDPEVDVLLGGGLSYGYSLTPYLAVEADFNYATIGGGYRTTNGGTDESGDYALWTLGTYAAARQPFGQRIYGKVKLGLNYENINKNSNINSRSSSLLSLSAGLGGGLVAGRVFGSLLTLEVEYVQLEQVVGAVSAAAHFTF